MKQKNRNGGCSLDYNKINDYIYLGSDFCCGRDCKDHKEEFEKLGVKVEIVLTIEEKETPPDNLELYCWIPVVDKKAPTKKQLDLGTSIINQSVINKQIVYVHCMNGHGRSPTMLAAYYIRYEGYKVNEATEVIKKKRSEVHLEEEQVKALRAFQDQLIS